MGRPEAASADGERDGDDVSLGCSGNLAGWGHCLQMSCLPQTQSHGCCPASSSDTPAKTPEQHRNGRNPIKQLL